MPDKTIYLDKNEKLRICTPTWDVDTEEETEACGNFSLKDITGKSPVQNLKGLQKGISIHKDETARICVMENHESEKCATIRPVDVIQRYYRTKEMRMASANRPLSEVFTKFDKELGMKNLKLNPEWL